MIQKDMNKFIISIGIVPQSTITTNPIIDLFFEHKGLDPGSNLIRIQPILMPLTFMETIAVMLVTFVKALMAD